MKFIFLIGFVFTLSLARAASLTATITEATKLEVSRGKGTIVLKAGSIVEVVSRDGDTLGVVYRSITGFVPAAKTNFKSDAPGAANLPAKPEAMVKSSGVSTLTSVAKSAESKTVAEKSTSPLKTDTPVTNYGKMVKKAQDNAAQHKDNLVDPVNDATAPQKN